MGLDMEKLFLHSGEDAPSPESLANFAASARAKAGQDSGNSTICGGDSGDCSGPRPDTSSLRRCHGEGSCHEHEETSAVVGDGTDRNSREAQLARETSWPVRLERIAQYVAVLCCNAVIFLLAHAYFVLALPWFEFSRPVYFALSVPVIGMFLRFLYDYARAVLTSPGQPEGPPVLPTPTPPDKHRWCLACNGPKPLRCHHCKICRRCVTRMDHHCVYIANCVGRHNQRPFVYALLEAVVLLCVSTAWSFPLLMEVICMNPDSPFGNASVVRRLHILAVFTTSCISLYLLGSVALTSMECVFNNETTIEGLGNSTHKRARPYFRGYFENFREVFGEPPEWCGESARWAIEGLGNLIDDSDFRL